MRRLYLRMFDDATKQVPTDSIPLNVTPHSSDMDVADEVKEQIDVIGDWMVKHPQGRTEFIWLP